MKKKILIILVIVLLITAVGGFLYYKNSKDKPEETLNEYISKINDEKYNEMYELLDEKSKQKITEEDFVSRNKKIYQGIDMSNMTIEIKDIKKSGSKRVIIYNTKMDASGGEITFDNEITLNNKNGYKIEWSSNLIFPELEDTDKVRVSTSKPSRGKILDRNGKELAGDGTASSIGIVPGKLSENKDEDINKIAELLGTTADTINKKLQAGWVTDESFVPLKTISSSDTELKDKLLQIKGVKISSTKVRYYSLGEAASQLTGYVQTITKEELEKNEGYTSTSLIGKSGLEQKYEEKLKGKKEKLVYLKFWHYYY